MKEHAFSILLIFCSSQAFASLSTDLVSEARAHLTEYLAVCDLQKCNLSYDENSWLRTTKHLAEEAPSVEFKSSSEMEQKLFIKKSKKTVWIDDHIPSLTKASDALVLWIEILLAEKNISRVALSLLEFELTERLDKELAEKAAPPF